MAKAVFVTKPSPAYDDVPWAQYHFPKTYLKQAQQAIGDWILYYEPRRPAAGEERAGGRMAYFATARVVRIEEDLSTPNHYYAFVEDYLDLPRNVPLRSGDHLWESGLRKGGGKINVGLMGRSVRLIPEEDFALILKAGDYSEIGQRGDESFDGFEEEQAPFERPIVETLVSRPLRDRAFSGVVRAAYEDACAMSGIHLINGGGHPEAEAAHIRPVKLQGPDTVRNGIALTGTLHWAFDRGLVSVDDDYNILIADRAPGIDRVKSILNPSGEMRLPDNRLLRPHPGFLRFHRESVFKG